MTPEPSRVGYPPMHTLAQIAEYFERELPGFQYRLSEGVYQQTLDLTVKGPIWFQGNAGIDLTYPLPRDDYNAQLQAFIDEMIRKTRDHAIKQLGLQGRIDARVEEEVRPYRAAAVRLEAEARKLRDELELAREHLSLIRAALEGRLDVNGLQDED